MHQLTTSAAPVNAADRLRAAQRRVLELAAELHTLDDQMDASEIHADGGLDDLAKMVEELRNGMASRLSTLADKALHDEVEATRAASLTLAA